MSPAEFDGLLAAEHRASLLVGVDEAGRGPLAGPVVACAAAARGEHYPLLSGVKDSKLLSEGKRRKLFGVMRGAGVLFGFGFAAPEEIDRINILQATFLAMRRAVDRISSQAAFSAINPALSTQHCSGDQSQIRNPKSQIPNPNSAFPTPHSPFLPPSSALVVVDGPHIIPGLPFRQKAVTDGDAKSLCVACASIFAKVLRDRWMEVLDKRFPAYGFARHKGYGTAAHMRVLREIGPSPVHRKSFAPVRTAEKYGQQ